MRWQFEAGDAHSSVYSTIVRSHPSLALSLLSPPPIRHSILVKLQTCVVGNQQPVLQSACFGGRNVQSLYHARSPPSLPSAEVSGRSGPASCLIARRHRPLTTTPYTRHHTPISLRSRVPPPTIITATTPAVCIPRPRRRIGGSRGKIAMATGMCQLSWSLIRGLWTDRMKV